MLLINGSVRKKGTSYSFAATFQSLAHSEGHEAEIIHVMDWFKQKKSTNDLVELIEQADIIGLIAPLYVDTLPYPVISMLEQLAIDHSNSLKGKSFFCVAQSGFFDKKLLEPPLAGCKFFALETEMIWLGGLAYGGGSLVDGATMEKLGKKGQKITSAFQLALTDILAGRPISPQAQEMIITKIPKFLYRPLAAYLNYNIKKTAKEKGISYAELTKKVY